jgi:hypothetical protein
MGKMEEDIFYELCSLFVLYEFANDMYECEFEMAPVISKGLH